MRFEARFASPRKKRVTERRHLPYGGFLSSKGLFDDKFLSSEMGSFCKSSWSRTIMTQSPAPLTFTFFSSCCCLIHSLKMRRMSDASVRSSAIAAAFKILKSSSGISRPKYLVPGRLGRAILDHLTTETTSPGLSCQAKYSCVCTDTRLRSETLC